MRTADAVRHHRCQPPKNNVRDKNKLSLGRGDAIFDDCMSCFMRMLSIIGASEASPFLVFNVAILSVCL